MLDGCKLAQSPGRVWGSRWLCRRGSDVGVTVGDSVGGVGTESEGDVGIVAEDAAV